VPQQLLQPLVVPVERPEERDRVGRVHEHRDAGPGCDRPDVAQPFVVEEEQLAALVPNPQADVLPHLEATRAAADRVLERRRQPARPARLLAGRPVQPGERDEPSRMGAVVAVEVGLQLAGPAAVEVHDRLDAGSVHRGDQRRHIADPPGAGVPAAQVVVDVDDRCLGPIDLGQRTHQLRTWSEVSQQDVGERLGHTSRLPARDESEWIDLRRRLSESPPITH
jgi:hypothetical protein